MAIWTTPKKTATLHIIDQADRLTVFIKDCGCGFDLGCVEDPLSSENLMKPCSRGIFLMRTLMDEVEYSMDGGSGTEVQLAKYRTSRKPRADKSVASSVSGSVASEEATELLSAAGLL